MALSRSWISVATKILGVLVVVSVVTAAYCAAYSFVYTEVEVLEVDSIPIGYRQCERDVPDSIEMLFAPAAWVEAKFLGVDSVYLEHLPDFI